jgi:hypothetical protein
MQVIRALVRAGEHKGRGERVISNKAAENGKQAGTLTLRSAEIREIAREVAALALIRVKQGGRLNIRQREDLRRALASAGEKMGWSATVANSDDPVGEVAESVKKIVRSGARSLKRELADELAAKKREDARLENVVEMAHELAADPSVDFPTEITYSHTAMDATVGLVTKTETVTVTDAGEALEAAKKIEQGMGRWGKLKVQMLEDIKDRQKRLGVLTGELSDFVESSHGLLKEIILTLP